MLHGGEGNLVFSDGLCGLAANWGGVSLLGRWLVVW